MVKSKLKKIGQKDYLPIIKDVHLTEDGLLEVNGMCSIAGKLINIVGKISTQQPNTCQDIQEVIDLLSIDHQPQNLGLMHDTIKYLVKKKLFSAASVSFQILMQYYIAQRLPAPAIEMATEWEIIMPEQDVGVRLTLSAYANIWVIRLDDSLIECVRAMEYLSNSSQYRYLSVSIALFSALTLGQSGILASNMHKAWTIIYNDHKNGSLRYKLKNEFYDEMVCYLITCQGYRGIAATEVLDMLAQNPVGPKTAYGICRYYMLMGDQHSLEGYSSAKKAVEVAHKTAEHRYISPAYLELGLYQLYLENIDLGLRNMAEGMKYAIKANEAGPIMWGRLYLALIFTKMSYTLDEHLSRIVCSNLGSHNAEEIDSLAGKYTPYSTYYYVISAYELLNKSKEQHRNKKNREDICFHYIIKAYRNAVIAINLSQDMRPLRLEASLVLLHTVIRLHDEGFYYEYIAQDLIDELSKETKYSKTNSFIDIEISVAMAEVCLVLKKHQDAKLHLQNALSKIKKYDDKNAHFAAMFLSRKRINEVRNLPES